MPSSTVVTDQASLNQNLSENAKEVLCKAFLVGGGVATGAIVIQSESGIPPLALATAGAVVVTAAICGDLGPKTEKILGVPPVFTGGQCQVPYRCTSRLLFEGNVLATEVRDGIGPISQVSVPLGGGGDTINWRVNDGRGNNITSFNISATDRTTATLSVVRIDGQPDNCGNQPSTGGQIITNNITGDTIDNSKVINNNNYAPVIPITFATANFNGTLNMRFGDLKIGSLFPISFTADVGGITIGFKQGDDGNFKPDPVAVKPGAAKDNVERLLQKIAACVCTPKQELSQLSVPFILPTGDCSPQSATIRVDPTSVPSALPDNLLSSALLAIQGCQVSKVVQLPEAQIFAATTLSDGRELFTGDIPPEVVSLKMIITSVNNDTIPVITTYPAANQRKFGSISFVEKTVNGGGDYIYVFDQETYYPLPKRGKVGKLRILMKAGISFTVFDTGERIRG